MVLRTSCNMTWKQIVYQSISFVEFLDTIAINFGSFTSKNCKANLESNFLQQDSGTCNLLSIYFCRMYDVMLKKSNCQIKQQVVGRRLTVNSFSEYCTKQQQQCLGIALLQYSILQQVKSIALLRNSIAIVLQQYVILISQQNGKTFSFVLSQTVAN